MKIKFLETATAFYEVEYELKEEFIEENKRIKEIIDKYKKGEITQDEAYELHKFVSDWCYINSSELLDTDDFKLNSIKDYEE